MSLTSTFDTLSYAKKLKAAGFTEVQAEVQAETLSQIIEDRLATKQDLKELEKNVVLKIESSKAETIKWVAGMLVAQAVIVATLVKLL
ncbi:MAG: DUF1640 domain-containing protein [Deltaproteobacteria bacterium]|nr:DUF1640 domain-containing protein [Deltaproteobacteria bacterium]